MLYEYLLLQAMILGRHNVAMPIMFGNSGAGKLGGFHEL
jgi:hypothetical protein